jgi:hypothetical protein
VGGLVMNGNQLLIKLLDDLISVIDIEQEDKDLLWDTFHKLKEVAENEKSN